MVGWSSRDDGCSARGDLPCVFGFDIFLEVGKCALPASKLLYQSQVGCSSRRGDKRSLDNAVGEAVECTCNGKRESKACTD